MGLKIFETITWEVFQLKKCSDCKFAERTVEFDGFCHFYKKFFTGGEVATEKEKQWERKPVFCELEFIKFGMKKKESNNDRD